MHAVCSVEKKKKKENAATTMFFSPTHSILHVYVEQFCPAWHHSVT